MSGEVLIYFLAVSVSWQRDEPQKREDTKRKEHQTFTRQGQQLNS